MKNMLIHTLIFIGVWLVSFATGVYLYGAACMEYELSGLDFVLDFCGFALSILWLWHNIMKSCQTQKTKEE